MQIMIKVFDIIFALFCVAVMTFVVIGSYTLPDKIVTYDNNAIPFSQIYSYSKSRHIQSVDAQTAYPRQETIKLLGIVPIKTVTVTNKPTPEVYASGEVFGIKLYTNGVIIVGTQSVNIDGKSVNPASDAGLQVGDVIVAINNTNVYSSTDVENLLNDNNGGEYKIKVKRSDRYRTYVMKPVFSNREGCYKAGMWVRDSTAGIGTITFYNQNNGTFAALGHPVNDVDTNEIMPLLNGEAVGAVVTSVQRGSSGNTGSLVCDFQDYTIGTLNENSDYGIYGAYTGISEYAHLYPVASRQEVKKGNAQIITTIDSSTPQKYDIEITHISYNERTSEQNMVIKVTDPKLIAKTGGIVQGMSGSPIIQDNKLIGAVTHVIINNPQKGYAIFAQTMLEESYQ